MPESISLIPINQLMRNPMCFALLFACTVTAMGQKPPLVTDNNPKVSREESVWLKANFGGEGFDYTGKYVGFSEVVSGGYYGIGKWIWPLQKKDLFILPIDKYTYRLFVLDSVEKCRTKGFDALLVLTQRRTSGKLKRFSRNSLVSEAKNQYPQIPSDAGQDTSAMLSHANAVFFNELYKACGGSETSFDFTNKKVAILNTHASATRINHGKPIRVSIPEYVEKIRSQLDQYARCQTDFTYYLTEEEKTASGGYDVIIQLIVKKDWPRTWLIKHVK